MKLRIEIMDEKEISEGAEEELVLRCRFPDERIMQLQRSLAAMIGAGGEICLHLEDEEFFVPYGETLFFERTVRAPRRIRRRRCTTPSFVCASLRTSSPTASSEFRSRASSIPPQ